MLEKTKGIVLRTVKYGDTSLIVSIFTEKKGLQSYLVKGVRSPNSKRMKANLLFPSSLLDLVVYHNPQRNLQYLKEFQTDYFYQNVGESILKNGIAIFAIEVLLQLIVNDNIHIELFDFTKYFLIRLDQCEPAKLANLPLFFLIQAGRISGYHLSGIYSETTPYLDLIEGRFTTKEAEWPPFISKPIAAIMSRLTYSDNFEAFKNIKINTENRKEILNHYLVFFKTHIAHFKTLKSTEILASILN